MGQIWPISTEFSMTPATIGSMSAKLAQNRRQMSTKFCPISSQCGPATLDQIWARNRPTLACIRSSLTQVRPTLARNCPSDTKVGPQLANIMCLGTCRRLVEAGMGPMSVGSLWSDVGAPRPPQNSESPMSCAPFLVLPAAGQATGAAPPLAGCSRERRGPADSPHVCTETARARGAVAAGRGGGRRPKCAWPALRAARS